MREGTWWPGALRRAMRKTDQPHWASDQPTSQINQPTNHTGPADQPASQINQPTNHAGPANQQNLLFSKCLDFLEKYVSYLLYNNNSSPRRPLIPTSPPVSFLNSFVLLRTFFLLLLLLPFLCLQVGTVSIYVSLDIYIYIFVDEYRYAVFEWCGW